MEKLTLETLYTPWTLDTYATFNMEGALEMNEANIDEDHPNNTFTWEDIDWTYDTKGYLKALADNLLELLKDNILDEVITGITMDGEPASPREYNFTTDKAWLEFTVDKVKLSKYIKDNQEAYDQEHIRSSDGFMWLGDQEHTELAFYLKHKSGGEYTSDDYLMDQFEGVHDYEYVDYTIKKTK